MIRSAPGQIDSPAGLMGRLTRLRDTVENLGGHLCSRQIVAAEIANYQRPQSLDREEARQ